MTISEVDTIGVKVGIGLAVGTAVSVGEIVSVADGAVVGVSIAVVGLATRASFIASLSSWGGEFNEHALITPTSKSIVIQRLNISVFSRLIFGIFE
jgi:hypothetical protein